MGVQLSKQTEVLTVRLHLGSALGGLILLAIAANLPEIAIVASAAVAGNVEVAVGNILGGIAIQTVVLVALDAFGVRGRNQLTYRAASLVLVLEAVLVVAELAVVVAGSQLPATLIAWRLDPAPILITILWVAGLLRGPAANFLGTNPGKPPTTRTSLAGTASSSPRTRPPATAPAPGSPRPSSAPPPS